MRKSILSLSIVCFAFCSVCAEQMPEHYYDRANGQKDGVLKDSLKSAIRKHTAIPYGTGANSTWGVFFYSDRDEEGYIMDMYCDQWYKVSSPGEAATGCNIEHSFAKSWWGGAENDAYKDCYHLNPSNSTANSARSNYPLGVPVKELKSNTGSLKVGKMHHPTMDLDFWVFEPKDEYKGDFARAYFYMATCYGHWSNGTYDPVCSAYQGWRLDNSNVGSKFAMQNDNYLEFQPWEQDVLIQWHRQDPVSIKEINRQDAVSNFQHNRNPFIDYPYLAEYIWGERAGENVNFNDLLASFEDEFVPGVSNGLRDGVTPVQKPKFGVSWSVNGVVIKVDSIQQNKKIQSMPETPESCSDVSTEFMGWTPEAISGKTDVVPERLYKAVKDIPSITEDITLYAVFAQKTTYEGGEAATYVFDEDHQSGWTINAENKSGYWLLDAGKTIVSPEISLAGLEYIKVRIRTYGGTQYNTLNVTAGEQAVAAITTNTGTTVTEYKWENTASLEGKSPLTFSTNYGTKQGIGLVSAEIKSTGTRIVYSNYLTSCNSQGMDDVETTPTARKFIQNGQLFIEINNQIYTITGQRL